MDEPIGRHPIASHTKTHAPPEQVVTIGIGSERNAQYKSAPMGH